MCYFLSSYFSTIARQALTFINNLEEIISMSQSINSDLEIAHISFNSYDEVLIRMIIIS